MAKNSYLGANVETTDTFSQWLSRTNQIVYDMGTVVLTAGSVAQPNTTNGASTSGNTHLDGILSANTVSIVTNIRGGTVSTPSNLNVTGNVSFTTANSITFASTVNLLQSDANALFTDTFSINAPTKTASLTSNNFIVNSANVDVNSAALYLHSDSVEIGENDIDSLIVNSNVNMVGPVLATNEVILAPLADEVIIGSTSGTADITLGRSTKTQVINVGSGITETGLTKTINIGTGGDIGSNTVLIIGSNTSSTNVYGDFTLNENLILGSAENKATILYSANTARTYTIPDSGADSNFVMTAGNQTISGEKSFANNATFQSTAVFNSDVFIDGELVISGNSNITTSIADINDLTIFDTLNMFSGARVTSSFIPSVTNSFDLGSALLSWKDVYANTVFLGAAGTTTTSAVRADRTLQIQAGQNVTIGGSGTSAQNLTANRSWTINAANTNITSSANTTVRLISSSTGSDVAIPSSNSTQAGVMSSADKLKLDGIETGAQVNVATNLGTAANTISRTITSSTGSSTILPTANSSQAGVMSSADRTKLDGIAAGAQVNVPTNLSIGSSTGTVVRIDSSTGTNATLPIASDIVAGVITNAAQTIAGSKTFSSTIIGNISGNAASANVVSSTATGTDSVTLVSGSMADSDKFRILVGGTATNAGFAEIATADDGTEPIYVRQYTGDFVTQIRSAALLDASGNTSFPGTVTASAFSGPLTGNVTGNASTASTWQTARTLTIGDTGKSVNGSGNVSWTLTEIGAADKDVQIIAGNGLTGGGDLTANRTVTLGTPGTLTGSTTNAVTTTSHTHEIVVNLGVTSGTTSGPTITSSAGTNATIPAASASASGVVTTGTQTFAGNKTFNNTVNAATFNATSLSEGGFQGIENDNVSAPSFTWSKDLGTGMFRKGPGTIGFASNGTEFWNIGSSGNLNGSNGADILISYAISDGQSIQISAESTGVVRKGAIGVFNSPDASPAGFLILDRANSTRNYYWTDNDGNFRTSLGANQVGTTGGTVVGTQTSDERLKEIDDTFYYGIEQVKALKPIRYKFTYDEDQTYRLGFGAQTTQEIVPESVYDTKECIDGYDPDPENDNLSIPRSDRTKLAMDSVQLIPVLTKALQEAIEKIEALEAKIDSLTKG